MGFCCVQEPANLSLLVQGIWSGMLLTHALMQYKHDSCAVPVTLSTSGVCTQATQTSQKTLHRSFGLSFCVSLAVHCPSQSKASFP